MTAPPVSLEEQIEACERAVPAWRDLDNVGGVNPRTAHQIAADRKALQAAAATLREVQKYGFGGTRILAAREQEQSQSESGRIVQRSEGQGSPEAASPAPSPAQAGVDDWQWLHRFINCTPFGEHAPLSDLKRAHDIVQRARDEIVSTNAAYEFAVRGKAEAIERIATLEKDLAAARDTIRSMKRQFQIARERP